MKARFIFTSAITVCLITACGGGSSGSDSGKAFYDEIQDALACVDRETTTDPYLVTSYDSCEASNTDLTGVWMIVSEYASTSEMYDRNHKQRFTMTITDNENDTLNAFICAYDKNFRNITFDPNTNNLVFFDEIPDTPINLSINNNVSMTGTHSSTDTVTILNSTVTAIKLKDNTSEALGTVNLDYELNSFLYSEENLEAPCFRQLKGTTTINTPNVVFDQESIYTHIKVDNNGLPEDVFISMGFPTDPNRPMYTYLTFQPSQNRIGNDSDGYLSIDSPETAAKKMHIHADVTDRNWPDNKASLDLKITM